MGKRKLAPRLSPSKTVEGAAGGPAVGLLFLLACFGYIQLVPASGRVNLWNALLVGLVCALAGMLGDLFASAVKREAGIKDYGRIMPGHSGVMDRFDSFLFTAPALLGLIRFLPIFTV